MQDTHFTSLAELEEVMKDERLTTEPYRTELCHTVRNYVETGAALGNNVPFLAQRAECKASDYVALMNLVNTSMENQARRGCIVTAVEDLQTGVRLCKSAHKLGELPEYTEILGNPWKYFISAIREGDIRCFASSTEFAKRGLRQLIEGHENTAVTIGRLGGSVGAVEYVSAIRSNDSFDIAIDIESLRDKAHRGAIYFGLVLN